MRAYDIKYNGKWYQFFSCAMAKKILKAALKTDPQAKCFITKITPEGNEPLGELKLTASNAVRMSNNKSANYV